MFVISALGNSRWHLPHLYHPVHTHWQAGSISDYVTSGLRRGGVSTDWPEVLSLQDQLKTCPVLLL